MILRVWHLSDAPRPNQIGTPYLHGEVEDWMAVYLNTIPEEEWEAPDLSVTDAAGVTTFVAAFGLNTVGTAEVEGIGRLANYPLDMVFVGLAIRMHITGDEPGETVLRLRGLIVNKSRQQEIIEYVESRKTCSPTGRVDLML